MSFYFASVVNSMSSFRHTLRSRIVSPICSRHCRKTATALDRASLRFSSNVIVEKEEGYAIMKMNKPPINSKDRLFLLELKDTLMELESDKDMQGLIITSAIPKVFSAGLDLRETHQASMDNMLSLWNALQDFWMVYYGSRLATIAAINGNCLPAGAICALACDYRIMTRGPYTIGFHESRLDAVISFWLTDLIRCTVGQRETERAMQLGISYSPEDAQRVGMVDELVDEENLMKRAREEMIKYLEISGPIRHRCKMQIRAPYIQALRERREEDALDSVTQLQSVAFQNKVKNFLQRKKK